MVWQSFSKRCQLKDRLSEYGVKLDGYQQPAKATGARKLHILVFGDSVDRVMVRDTCEIGNGTQHCVLEFESACYCFLHCALMQHCAVEARVTSVMHVAFCNQKP